MIETKFDLGSNVCIKVCGIRGIVVLVSKTGQGIIYEVAYQNHEGDPAWSSFSEMELEDVESNPVGFRREK